MKEGVLVCKCNGCEREILKEELRLNVGDEYFLCIDCLKAITKEKLLEFLGYELERGKGESLVPPFYRVCVMSKDKSTSLCYDFADQGEALSKYNEVELETGLGQIKVLYKMDEFEDAWVLKKEYGGGQI